MNGKSLRFPILIALFALSASAAWAGNGKIQICHIPPGNPGNWHTLTISQNALPAHQAHGDLVGSCLANCESLCDDGNKCTIDAVPSTTECLCQSAPRPAVDCSDGRACTTDSCNPAQGCLAAPVVCQAPDLCTASVCSEPAGSCLDTPVACPANQTCNPSNGACESATAVCPCTSLPEFNAFLANPVGCFTFGDDVRLELFNASSAYIVAEHTVCGYLTFVEGGQIENSIPTTSEQGEACLQLFRDVIASHGFTCLLP